MDWIDFLDSYKTVLGGFSIAIATVIAVIMNMHHNTKAALEKRREKSASLASALASELIDNSHVLMDFYFQIEEAKEQKKSVIYYNQINSITYEKLLEQIGELGSDLSFMIVDVYGDIRRLKKRLDVMEENDLLKKGEELIPEIQELLVKAMTSSIVMYFYADYMSGKKWMETIMPMRLLWLERALDEFFSYVGRANFDIDIAEENKKQDFLKRIKDKKKRELIKNLFYTTRNTMNKLYGEKHWRAQLTLSALSYRLKNTFTLFLDGKPSDYDRLSELQYQDFLTPNVR